MVIRFHGGEGAWQEDSAVVLAVLGSVVEAATVRLQFAVLEADGDVGRQHAARRPYLRRAAHRDTGLGTQPDPEITGERPDFIQKHSHRPVPLPLSAYESIIKTDRNDPRGHKREASHDKCQVR